MIESFILKIASSVLGTGYATSALKAAIEIHAIFEAVDALNDCVNSINICDELSDQECEVLSDKMTEKVVEKILDLGSDSINVERRKSGLYVATRACKPILVPERALIRETRWNGLTVWQTGR